MHCPRRLLITLPILCIAPLSAQATDPGTQFAASSFTPPGAFQVLADLDGDGMLDVLSQSATELTAVLNDGRGGFLPPVTRILASYPNTLPLVGDLDGDGDADAVVDRVFGVIVLRGDGAGNFVETARLEILANIQPTALADFDGDGDLDLLTGQTALRLWRNDGTGRFAEDLLGPPPGGYPHAVATDIDLDGDIDLLTGAGTAAHVLLNNGFGRFTDAGPLPNTDLRILSVPADYDGDGDLDLVLAPVFGGTLSLLLRDPNGNYTDASSRLAAFGVRSSTGVHPVDLDADGDMDFVMSEGSQPPGDLRLFVNQGGARFTEEAARRLAPGQTGSGRLTVGDVDGDGDADLLLLQELLVNRQRGLALAGPPNPGATLQLTHLAAPRLAGTGLVSVPFVGLPVVGLPRAGQPLPTGGLWFLDPPLSFPMAPIALPSPSGIGTSTVTIPNDPGLRGLEFGLQSLIVEAGRWVGPTNGVFERVR